MHTYKYACVYLCSMCICKWIPCVNVCVFVYIIEGSLEVKLPTIWTDGKHSQEKVRREKIRHLQLQVHFNYNYTALPATTCRSISGFALPSIIHSNHSFL